MTGLVPATQLQGLAAGTSPLKLVCANLMQYLHKHTVCVIGSSYSHRKDKLIFTN